MEVGGPVSYTSLKHYVKLPTEFGFKEAQEVTGLSRSVLSVYIYGDWNNGNLIEGEKRGRKRFFTKLNNSSNPKEIAKELLANRDICLIGYGIPEELRRF